MPRPGDVEFGPMNDLAEMARIASSYTSRLSPEQVRLSRIGRFIWLRFDVGSKLGSNGTSSQFAMARSGVRMRSRSITTNLVFRLAVESARPVSFARPFRDLRAASPIR
jgi:hypothetical protein